MAKCSLCFLILILCSLNAQTADEDWVYTTRPGDTLWDISKTYLIGVEYWPKVQKHNAIANPKLLPPGSRLLIPVSWLKQQPSPAVIIAVSGSAKVKVANKEDPLPISIGMEINIQSKIITEEQSTVILRFADESRLVIQQNSIVDFNILSAHGTSGMVDTRMRLQQGRIESRVKPFKNKKSRFEITTPAAVASVRGTQFRVSMNPESLTMFSEVIEGKVAVASEGVTQIVPAGFGTKAVKGKPPESPKQLLPAVDLSQVVKVFNASPVNISWPPLIGAKSYHVQVAHSADFVKTFLDKYVSVPNFSWNTTEIGQFSLKVSGVSDSGSEGLSSVHQFSVINDLPVPKLVGPRNNSLVKKQNPVFQWLGHADAKSFQLQVSSSPNFDVVEFQVSGNQQHYSVPKKLKPGTYHWRVANKYHKGIVGKYSETYQFNIEMLDN